MNKEELIHSYYPIVKRIVRKLVVKLPDSFEEEDFIQVGMLGLLKAIDNWDESKSLAEFKSYANTKIRGAILDKIRSVDKVSRYARDKLKKVSNSYRELMDGGNFDPSDEEVAKKAQLSLDEFNKLMADSSNNTILSIDETISDDMLVIESIEDKNSKTPESLIEDVEKETLLKEALLALTKTELTVLSLYYYEDFNMKEIASIIKKTESRVSQIKTKSLIKLREYVKRRLENG
jgi:RNA polymerase sigma factor for flagellar operon FliA